MCAQFFGHNDRFFLNFRYVEKGIELHMLFSKKESSRRSYNHSKYSSFSFSVPNVMKSFQDTEILSSFIKFVVIFITVRDINFLVKLGECYHLSVITF
jgi:hypothetical protein